ncbi:hypothetical protein TRVL_04145 [Trypanosoma vivax]|nr:hypothetical protein TRVL_04145 [Trypanosoma vivax]
MRAVAFPLNHRAASSVSAVAPFAAARPRAVSAGRRVAANVQPVSHEVGPRGLCAHASPAREPCATTSAHQASAAHRAARAEREPRARPVGTPSAARPGSRCCRVRRDGTATEWRADWFVVSARRIAGDGAAGCRRPFVRKQGGSRRAARACRRSAAQRQQGAQQEGRPNASTNTQQAPNGHERKDGVAVSAREEAAAPGTLPDT